MQDKAHIVLAVHAICVLDILPALGVDVIHELLFDHLNGLWHIQHGESFLESYKFN